MPNPPNAKLFDQQMDPADLMDWQSTISQGDDDSNMLRPGEGVASFTLIATAEAVAAGLQIEQLNGRAPTIANNVLRFWLSVVAGQQSTDIFGGAGVVLAIELTIVTNSVPSRTRQRTMLVQVAQQ